MGEGEGVVREEAEGDRAHGGEGEVEMIAPDRRTSCRTSKSLEGKH